MCQPNSWVITPRLSQLLGEHRCNLLVLSLPKESRVAASAAARRWLHCRRVSPSERLSLRDARGSWWEWFAVWSLIKIKQLLGSECVGGDGRSEGCEQAGCAARGGQASCARMQPLFWEGGKSSNPTQNAAGGAAAPRCSTRFSPQAHPFMPSGCTQCRILAEITSPSIQAARSSPPRLQKAVSPQQYKY